jgi:hypothetical protein
VTSTEFKKVLVDVAAAWARRDYTKAASFFEADVRYGDPLRYLNTGREQLRNFFENDEGFEQKTVWHNVIFDESQQLGAAEYTYDGTHRYHGTVLIRVKDGLITHWREYQHIDSRDWETFVGPTSWEK